MLREEINIKDGRWERSRSKRRPHYTPVQRMRILPTPGRPVAGTWRRQRGCSSSISKTLLVWMRRLDEQGEPALIQTANPVNRYPDFVRNLVRQLKCLFPAMGTERMAHVLARAGLVLGATTIRRMLREPSGPPEVDVTLAQRRHRRVVARYPGHTWHVDLTAVPTRAGLLGVLVPVLAATALAVLLLGCRRGRPGPPGRWLASRCFRSCRRRTRSKRFSTVRSSVSASLRDMSSPTRASKFWCRSFKRWCKRRSVRPRYGRIGEPASIAVVERFIGSMKRECTRRILGPLSLVAMRRELRLYSTWYNTQRPHMFLDGKTPRDVYAGRTSRKRRLEPRRLKQNRIRKRKRRPNEFRLAVSYVEGRKTSAHRRASPRCLIGFVTARVCFPLARGSGVPNSGSAHRYH